MRIHTMLTSSAALAALCGALLIGGCGGGTPSEDEGASPTLRDGELGGASPSSGGSEASDPSTSNEVDGKITICHVPPGNPANAHTLVVGSPGWNGHQHHQYDYEGPCEGSTSEPDAGTGTEPDAGTSEPVCLPEGASCGGDGEFCCDGLECYQGLCRAPIIIN